MSNPPDNPSDPKGPWLYSGAEQSTPGYYSQPAVPGPAPSTPPISPPKPPTTPPASVHPPFPPPQQSDTSLASAIDTIEAVIIALVIALTFRAFIVEAFVIPTGSMAPTLLGAHFKVICPKCGYEFDKNARLDYQARIDNKGQYKIVSQGDHGELNSNRLIPADELPIYCPNCRYPIAAAELPQFLNNLMATDERPGRGVHTVPFVWANNGDRILVLKYLYAVQEPHHWDVIVFKEPNKAKDNYIKRLIGLPGETVEVINGDVFIGEPGKTRPEDRNISRKPEYIQQNVWQLVYDNDYYPIDENKDRPQLEFNDGDARRPPRPSSTWTNPWISKAAWSKGPVMKYDGKDPTALAFDLTPDFTRDAPYALNTLGYNNDAYVSWNDPNEFAPRSFVGDLRLETVWTPATSESDPSIQLTLGRPTNCYQVAWSSGRLELRRYNVSTDKFDPVPGATVASPPARTLGQSYRLAFNNVDHAVQFYIDGKKVISHEQPWTARDAADEEKSHPAQYDPLEIGHQAPELPRIAIDVNGPCTLAHLKLMRDLFHTQVLGDHMRTATLGHPLTLGLDEFFAMGDNSRESSDGRLWGIVYPALDDVGTRPGIVPRRYLLGKAFFVYWPAGFRPTNNDNIPFLSQIPLVPNTGNMRLIR